MVGPLDDALSRLLQGGLPVEFRGFFGFFWGDFWGLRFRVLLGGFFGV